MVAGEATGSKYSKAQELGIPILDEAAFLKMIGAPETEQTHPAGPDAGPDDSGKSSPALPPDDLFAGL